MLAHSRVAALCELPAARLKQAAFLCGSVLSGRKAHVAEKLYALCTERAPSLDPCRIVSIDLGVKNIGICRLRTPRADEPESRPVVESWQLASLPSDLAFTYPEFSTAAIKLLREQLSYAPVDAIIMEKQRSRTAGSPMIPNAILRVNVMEGMLFTASQTLFPHIHAESISPRQIVDFWRHVYEDELPSRAKKMTTAQSYRASKKVRRTLLNRWTAEPEVAPIRFELDVDPTRSGKRDDMDDALVQALAWAQWRTNSRILLKNLADQMDPLHRLIGAHRIGELSAADS